MVEILRPLAAVARSASCPSLAVFHLTVSARRYGIGTQLATVLKELMLQS